MTDWVTVTIDGREVQARKGAMLIEVTDQYDIHVPRFCYHKKLSVAANCRMCMVEVEKAPKPLPACATPVADGMVVKTRSDLALDAQRGTMEFLLINHPLDCPICDQGGECELQDLAIGYGRDVSRFTEQKRVVADKNIGPLVSTDMTRCIHCTRCVRFGEEIAGIRELGATGRGEFMEIGTFVEKSLSSELSGNVIDLCPVGALNAKPSRMQGRPWEMLQHDAISPHDSVGSNLHIHVLRDKVMRVVPRDNEQINETWISDRDRFSYEGMYSDDRLLTCMQKQQQNWKEVSWESALSSIADLLKSYSADDIGVLISPQLTNEEIYLAQKLFRDLGVRHIDHRINRIDFCQQNRDVLFPWLGQSIQDLENQQTVLLIGSDIRFEQPMITHRLRKMVQCKGELWSLNAREFDWYIPNVKHLCAAPQYWVEQLLSVMAALPAESTNQCPNWLQQQLAKQQPTGEATKLAARLHENTPSSVLLGELSFQHANFALLQSLAYWLSKCTGAIFGFVPQYANSAGAALCGALPNRGVAGAQVAEGFNYRQMLEQPRKVYVCIGVEAEFDTALPQETRNALRDAEQVIQFTSFMSNNLMEHADWVVPISLFAENEGSYVNLEGRWQSFESVVSAAGESKPLWKVLRRLANKLELQGYDYHHCVEVREELKQYFNVDLQLQNEIDFEWSGSDFQFASEEVVWTASHKPIYSIDALCRHASSLQFAQIKHQETTASISSKLASALGVKNGDWVEIMSADANSSARVQCYVSEEVANHTVWLEHPLLRAGITQAQCQSVSIRKAAE